MGVFPDLFPGFGGGNPLPGDMVFTPNRFILTFLPPGNETFEASGAAFIFSEISREYPAFPSAVRELDAETRSFRAPE